LSSVDYKKAISTWAYRAVKIDAMQHCTIYTDTSFGDRVQSLDEGQNLLAQLDTSITRKTSPIWEDRSPVKKRNT